jgi:hypothetical protein
MAAVLYRCPKTGMAVQAWFSEAAQDDESFETVTCTACAGIHYVNPMTGKVLGGDEGSD